MRASKTTLHYRRLAVLFYALSVIAFLTPLATFGIIAAMNRPSTVQLRCMIACGVAAFLFFIIDLFRKGKFRTVGWLILTAVCICCDAYRVQLCIFVTTGCVILDELIFSPLKSLFVQKARINHEIDKRS